MDINQCMEYINSRFCLFDIGQLDKKTRHQLNKEVKAGNLIKSRELWPFVTFGTFKKTCYSIPGYIDEVKR